MTFAIGATIGPYLITDQLGRGGMATVFKAYHANLDRHVAIKVLHPAFKEDPGFLERFKREAQIVARLEHPNIIPVYDFADFAGQPYLVMKFIEGETLKTRLKQSPLALSEKLALLEKVAEALEYAHAQGILHRDIKPSNIMLDRWATPYIADFGLARIAQAGESTLSQDMMLGTPQYISPEQAKGLHNLGPTTDIYSLGVVIYEMFVGRVPFNADTPYAIVHDHIFKPLPLPTQINVQVAPEIERVLLRALAKEPEARFASAVDMVADLQRAAASASTRVQTLGAEPPKAAEAAVSATTATIAPESSVQPSLPAYTFIPSPTNIQSDSSQSRHAYRRRANLWIMGGLGALLLTCLASLFIIARAVSDPELQPWNIHDQADAAANGPGRDGLAVPPPFDFRPDMTVAEAQNLVDSQPTEPQSYIYLALAYAQAGDKENALATLSAAITQLNPSGELIAQFAGYVASQDYLDVAAWLYLEALVTPQSTPEIRNQAGEYLFTAAQTDPLQTRLLINQFLDQRSQDASVYVFFALTLIQSGRELPQRQAITALNKAFELNDSLDEAYLVRGLYYRADNQIDLAIADWTQAARFTDAPPWVIHETETLLRTYQ